MTKKTLTAAVLSVSLLFCGCGNEKKPAETSAEAGASAETTAKEDAVNISAPKLTLFGHSSIKIVTTKGTVVYIDPAREDGDYSEPADVILVSHEHFDHNKVNLVTTKDTTVTQRIKQNFDENKGYTTNTYNDVTVETVPAENSNHNINACVGYIISFDGIGVYFAGDTSKLDSMETTFKDRTINYAFLPIDGVYNMDAAEAMECAKIIGAKHNTPIHIVEYNEPYDEAKAKTFAPENALYIPYGETIALEA